MEETHLAKLTIGFGFLLVAISAGFWIAIGRTESAALHPAGVGIILILSGLLANTENVKQRMLWMHIAVTFGLIGFLITGIQVGLTLLRGTMSTKAWAFDERAAVAVVCFIYVVLCVRSFIAARRTRVP
jgi:hypothetical protein